MIVNVTWKVGDLEVIKKVMINTQVRKDVANNYQEAEAK